MQRPIKIALIIGSGPNAVAARDLPRNRFDSLVAINNAWRLRRDWSHLIHPDDFPIPRRPLTPQPDQTIIRSHHYIPSQNAFGGVVYAGGTMAFTAGYWAVDQLRPDILAYIGCDMVYPTSGKTHFYGKGMADPLRPDVTLQDLEAKSARLSIKAAQSGVVCVNLSNGPSRLVFPHATLEQLGDMAGEFADVDHSARQVAEAMERDLDYRAPDGRYWHLAETFDRTKLAAIDAAWRRAQRLPPQGSGLAESDQRLSA